MDELLKALQAANALPELPVPEEGREPTELENEINRLACKWFITREGRIDIGQMDEFRAYAPCKIYPVERDSFGWLVGCILYNGRKYYFG